VTVTRAKIVVAVDFSAEATLAIAHAMSIARRTDAELVLLHVDQVPPPESERPDNAWAVQERQRLAGARAALSELRERLSGQGVAIAHLVAHGYADTAIAEAARELHAELVVVGSHGRTGLKRVLLGSVAERTVRLAESSVLVARGIAPAGGYRNVIVGVDESEARWRVLDRARTVAAPDATVQVVHAAIESTPEGLGSMEVEVVEGMPVEVLAERSRAADLIVVGSHGRRGVRRLLLGSVAEATVRHARCSVLVAR